MKSAIGLVILLAFNLCNASVNTDSLNLIQSDSTEIKGLEASYSLANENHDSSSMSNAGLRLGELYLKEGRIKPAIALLEEAYLYNKKSGLEYQLAEAASILAKAYEQQKKYPSAYYYLLEAAVLKDKLKAGEENIIGKMQSQLEADIASQEKKLQSKDEDLKNANEKYETTFNYFFITTGVLLLTLVIMLFVVFRIKQKTTKALTEINALLESERSKIVEKLKDEQIIYPPVHSLSQLTYNESELSLLKKLFHHEVITSASIVEPQVPQKKSNVLLEETIPNSLVILEDALKKGNWQHIQSAVQSLQQLLIEAEMNDLLPFINEFKMMDGATPYLTWHQKTKSLVKAVQQKLT